jgi:hypothetical protein
MTNALEEIAILIATADFITEEDPTENPEFLADKKIQLLALAELYDLSDACCNPDSFAFILTAESGDEDHDLSCLVLFYYDDWNHFGLDTTDNDDQAISPEFPSLTFAELLAKLKEWSTL